MAVFHPGYVTREMIDSEVEAAVKKLGPEVVRVRYDVGVDWKDDPGINFRIVITDAASRKEVLGVVSDGIRQLLIDELIPSEDGDCSRTSTFANSPNKRNVTTSTSTGSSRDRMTIWQSSIPAT